MISGDASVDRWQALCQQGLFGMAFVMAKEVEVSSTSVILTMIVDFAQMLAFPINSSPKYPWRAPGSGDTVVGSFARAVSYITPDTLDQVHSERTFVTVFCIAMLWTAIFVALAAWVAWSFSQRMPQVALVLRALRSVAWLSTTVLFLPFTSVLMRGLACPDPDDWMGTGMKCWAGGHLAVTLLQALLLPCFIGLSLFTASVFISRDVRRPAMDSKVDGRADVAMLAIKVVLTAVYNIPDSSAMESWAVVLLVVLSGLAWPALMQLHRPFITPAINDLQTGLGTGYLWACIVLMFAKLGSSTTDYSVAMFAGMTLAIAAGAAISRVRQQRTQSLSLNKLRSVYDFHVWAAMKLDQARKLENMDESSAREAAQGRLGSLTLMASRRSAQQEEENWGEASDAEAGAMGSMEAGNGAAASAVASVSATERMAATRQLVQGHQLYKTRMLQGLRSQAELAYREMLQHHPNSAIAHVMAAQFFRLFHDNKYMEMATLNKARGMSSALDVRFFVHQRTQQLREEADGDRSGEDGARERRAGLSPIDRVLFDQQSAECRRLYKTAYRQMLTLWDTLREHVPDLVDIQRTGNELQRVLERMQQLYNSMLTINPESTAVLRSYADFLLTLAGDQAKAMEAVNKADRLDEVHAKQQSKAVQHVVLGSRVSEQLSMMDDKAVTVTFSGDITSLGEVLSVSNAATAVFGYARLQLVGQHFGTLMPPPLRTAFTTMLRQFTRTGRGSLFGTTRVMLGQAKAGHIFPMYLTMREAPPGRDSLAPRFVAVMRPVQTSENFLLLGNDKAQFRVYAACSRSLDALGVDPDSLASRTIPATALLPALSRRFSAKVPVSTECVASDDLRDAAGLRAACRDGDEAGAGTASDGRPVVTLRALDLGSPQEEQLTCAAPGTIAAPFVRVRVQDVHLPLPEPALLITWRVARLDMAALQAMQDQDATAALIASGRMEGFVASARLGRALTQGRAGDRAPTPARYREGTPTSDTADGTARRDDTEAASEADDDGEGEEESKTSGAALRRRPADGHSFATFDADAARSMGSSNPGSGAAMLPAPIALIPEVQGADDADSDASADTNALVLDGSAGAGRTEETPAGATPAAGKPVISPPRKRRLQAAFTDAKESGASSDEESPSVRRVAFLGRRHRSKYAVHPMQEDASTVGGMAWEARSEGHSSEHSSKANSMTRLRRTLQTMQKQVEPEVRIMQRGLLLNVFAVIAVAVLMGIGYGWQRDQMVLQFQSLRMRGDRLARLQQGMTSIRVAGAADVQGHTVLGTLAQRTGIFRQQMEHFDQLHRAVTALNSRVGPHSMELAQRTDLIILQPRPMLPPLRYNVTRPEAGDYMAAQARAVLRELTARENTAAFWQTFRDVVTFRLNFPVVKYGMEGLVHSAQLDFGSVIEQTQVVKVSVFVSVFSVTLLVSAALYIRAIRSLKRRADSILLLFLCIPRHVVKVARDQAMLRFEMCIAQELEDEEAAEAERDTSSVVNARGAGEVTEARAMAPEEPEGVDWQAVFARKSGAAPERERQNRDTSTFVLRSTVLILLPLLAVAIWGTTSFVSAELAAVESVRFARRMMLSQLQMVETYDIIGSTQILMDPNTTREERAEAQLNADTEARIMLRLVNLLARGGTVPPLHPEFGVTFDMPALDEDSPMARVVMRDACVATTNRTSCAAAFDGVFTKGSAAALTSLVSLARSVVFNIDLDSNHTALTPAMQADLGMMLRMANPYLQEIFNVTATDFHKEADRILNDMVSAQVVAAALFVVVFSLAILVFYRPMASKLANQLRSTRSLLLVIPEPVVQNVPSLTDGVQQVLMRGEVEMDEIRPQKRRRRKMWCKIM